jgi:DNA-binding NtrC family response regulator
MGTSRVLFLGTHPESFLGSTDSLRSRSVRILTLPARADPVDFALQTSPDVLLIEVSDARPSEWSEIVSGLRRARLSAPIILVTSCGSETLAVQALRAGLQDYFVAPVSPEELLASIQRCAASSDRPSSTKSRSSAEPAAHEMIGGSAVVREMRRYIERAAASDCTVLITGETGTGKELVAEFIHGHSKRSGKPFVCLNCAAIPESLFESELFGHTKGAFTGAETMHDGLLSSAEGGTIFLDEVGDMSLVAQAKILRVLENKEVCRLGGTHRQRLDIRFVAATNQNVTAMAYLGTFRKDLLFRLNVAQVHVPPLRDRTEDIPLLADYFLRRFCGESGLGAPVFSEDCLRCLLQYDWPGNIRELKNVMEGLFLEDVSSPIGSSQLPSNMSGNRGAAEESGKNERELLLSALFSANWNKSQAADKLHWSRMTLYRKLAKYNLSEKSQNPPRLRNDIAYPLRSQQGFSPSKSGKSV